MSSRGFTLIEVLASLVIFLLIAVGVGVGLHHAVDNNIFDSQRQDVLAATQARLDAQAPNQICLGPSTLPGTTASGVAFTISISCSIDNVPMPYPKPTTTVPVTQVMATATWTTLGVTRHVTVQE